MNTKYTVNGETIELQVASEWLAVRFQEPAPYSSRSAFARSEGFDRFEERFEIPGEKFTIFRTGTTTHESMRQMESTVESASQKNDVDRVSLVFSVGDGYAITTDRLLVGCKSSKSGQKILNRFGEITELESNLFVLTLSPQEDPFEIAQQLNDYDEIEFAEPDFVSFGKRENLRPDRQDGQNSANTANNPLQDKQYAVEITQADKAWKLQNGNSKIRIAILDEGVETVHPDLAGAIVGNYDGVDDDSFQEPKPWDAHGTACAGLAAAVDNNLGIRGIGSGCSILAARIAYSSRPGGNWVTRNSWIARAISWAWKNGADILSNSWGGGTPSQAITDAFEDARTKGRNGKGAVILVAAGNGSRLHDFPGNLDNVFTISASNEYDEPKTKTSRDGEYWWGSNYGPKIDIAAPGVHNYTTDNTGSDGYNNTRGTTGHYYKDFNGTSSSTPIVAGAAALILSANPDLTEQEVREVLQRTADKVGPVPYRNGRNDQMGHGRLNVLRAVKATKQTDDNSTPTGRHSPVTNQVQDSESEVTMLAETNPDIGTAKTEKIETRNGLESVQGSKPKSRAVARFIAPDVEDLPDIATASYGQPEAGPRSIIGPDDRRRISNTHDYPWRATASLLITAKNDRQYIGTGWFIGANTLVTAGHVVYIHKPSDPTIHGWVKRIEVMPGRNGSELPYGSATSEHFFSVKGWTEERNHEYDYGAIKLNTDLGNTVGTFGFGVLSNTELESTIGNLAGYPGDKPSGTLWYHNSPIRSVSTRKVYYEIDTSGGNSGGCVYRIASGKRTAFGIHAYGGSTSNSATRITTPVYQNLTNWNRD